MSLGLTEQHERKLTIKMITSIKPWRMVRRSYRNDKDRIHRRERQKCRADVECHPSYKSVKGWEW
jgi:hypothetical protein